MLKHFTEKNLRCPVSGVALRHFLRITGIIAWPIGWALCASITQGLIQALASQDVLSGISIGIGPGNGLANLLAIALIALWIVVSSIAAPAFVQQLLTGIGGVAQLLIRSGELAVTASFPHLVAGVQSLAASIKSSEPAPPAISPESLVPPNVSHPSPAPENFARGPVMTGGANPTAETKV